MQRSVCENRFFSTNDPHPVCYLVIFNDHPCEWWTSHKHKLLLQKNKKNVSLLQGLLWSRDKTLNTFYRTILSWAHPPKGVSRDILWESLSLQYSATSSCSNSSSTRNLTKKKKKRSEAEERQKKVFLKNISFLLAGSESDRFCKGKETVNKLKWACVKRK